MGVEQYRVVGAADNGESARALAVLYSGHGGCYKVALQGHGETDQSTDRAVGLGRVVSDGPLASGWI